MEFHFTDDKTEVLRGKEHGKELQARVFPQDRNLFSPTHLLTHTASTATISIDLLIPTPKPGPPFSTSPTQGDT